MAKAAPASGDRVDVDGRRGTLIAATSKGWQVLFNDGPKQASTTAVGRVVGPCRRTCDRCGSTEHHAFDCPKLVTP